jgi:hypothetical protein
MAGSRLAGGNTSRNGGGLLRILRKRGTRGTCRWKALRSVKAASFDEGVVEAILAFWFDLTRAG